MKLFVVKLSLPVLNCTKFGDQLLGSRHINCRRLPVYIVVHILRPVVLTLCISIRRICSNFEYMFTIQQQ